MAKDLVADIKARLTVDEVVGSYLTLKKTGRNYKALSPFKSEKTPSLMVTPQKEIWKDFSSGKGGDIFSFVMEYEGVDYVEALRILATKAGLDFDTYQRQSGRSRTTSNTRKEVLKVLEETASFYQEQLKKSQSARLYLKKRGFSPKIINQFRIGYSPDNWHGLYDHLKARKLLKYAGAAAVIVKRPVPDWLRAKEKMQASERWGDFFAGRIMIPLTDPQGAIVGFTARLLVDKQGIAKYINSRQTIVYDKSRHVFGYFQAKDCIRKEGYALVVEGNLDVVACHQAGYCQTVAAAGTALTVEQLKIIKRITEDVRLAFDGDDAGVEAMERSLVAASEAEVNLSIVSLPEGMDPDDLIKRNPKLWQMVVANHQPALEWLFEKYKASLDLSKAAGKKRLTDVMLAMISRLKDEVEQDHYLNQLSQEGISRASLDKKLKLITNKSTKNTKTNSQSQAKQGVKSQTVAEMMAIKQPQNALQDRLFLFLGLLLAIPELRQITDVHNQDLQVLLVDYPDAQKVYNIIIVSDLVVKSVQKLPDNLQPYVDCVKISLGKVDAKYLLERTYAGVDSAVRKEIYDFLLRYLLDQAKRKQRQAK